MNQSRVLYTSAEVRNTVIKLFSTSKGRRVAITAFVGKGAEAYLPKPDGIELVCWPKAGGTNPNSLRNLIKRGVQVSFVNSLHMKVYWTEDKGAVVTSANLSTNALGVGNLQELGVYLPAGQIDIDKILSSLQRQPVSNEELSRLDKLHHEYQKRIGYDRARIQHESFLTWYKSPFRRAWKLGWWDSESSFSSTAKKVARDEYNVSTPHDFIACQKNDYKANEWILSFYLAGKSPSSLFWMSVDYVVRTPKSDKVYSAAYPYQAVQMWSLEHYPPPPFSIDKRFRNAFSKAVREFGAEELKSIKSLKPSKWLVDFIFNNY